MHSSRMRTGRSLTICQGGVPEECVPEGVCARGACARGGWVWSRGGG